MPIGFLVPAFLAGLAALLVPVLLHLRRRERRKPRPFPSLMFLERLPVRTDARRRITDWPLLLLRALAVTLLVAAFARPFLTDRSVTGPGAAGLTVLLLDRSASMAAAGSAATWQDSARAVIDRLAPGRRVAVVGYDATATILHAPGADHGAALAAIAAAPPAAGATRHGAGLRAAAQLLAHETVPGEIVVVSDLQRAGLAAGNSPALPAGTTVRTVAVVPASRDNAAVTAVDVEQFPAANGRRVLVAARVDRHGGGAARSVEAVLEVDGRELSRRAVVLPPVGHARVTFDTVTAARGAVRLVVRLAADGLAADDRWHGVMPADGDTRVLLVAPADMRPEERRYLEQALAIGHQPTFAVERVTRLEAAMIDRSAAIVLLDVVPPAGAVGEELQRWLRDGGGLVIVPGERAASRRAAIPFAPAVVRGSTIRERGTMLGDAETSHPALSAFQGAAVDGFASVRVRQHPRIEAAGHAAILLRYDDGEPAVVAGAVGAGRTMMVAIPLDTRGGDFPLQPAFLPFLRGVVTWAAGTGDGSLAVASGEPWPVPAGVRTPVIRGPGGDVTRATTASRLVAFREAGIHEVHDGNRSGLPAAVVAVNLPPSEADLAAMDPAELLLGVADAPPASAMTAPEATAAREARQQGWRWILIALLAILVLEALVASRGWRAVAVQPATTGVRKETP